MLGTGGVLMGCAGSQSSVVCCGSIAKGWEARSAKLSN